MKVAFTIIVEIFEIVAIGKHVGSDIQNRIGMAGRILRIYA
jgi:hypothetical protein